MGPTARAELDVTLAGSDLPYPAPVPGMVEATERDGMTWYQCELCGLLFDEQSDANQHEENCSGDEPDYLQ